MKRHERIQCRSGTDKRLRNNREFDLIKERNEIQMKNTNVEIVRAQAEDAAALLDYLKIVGGETDNLSFGAEGVPLDVEAEKAYLGMQAKSCDSIQLLAKVNGEIIGTASLNRKQRRMGHRAEFGISLKKAWWGCEIGRASCRERV